ncbi:hypothetical protein F2Q69_00006932 [Brassica cretica]|uniref:Uncharacterized protein n=1 Tax=Brassica cretica TaxID=69181 RepID=A0A8S9NTN2_BRACR|nr:hypothetical protein F2Q69_00006932 [Brassica cretica]
MGQIHGLSSFRDAACTRSLQVHQLIATDFQGELTRLEFHPELLLLRDPANRPRRRPMPQAARAPHEHREAPLPDFPIIPDIPMRDQGDFQRVVVDALHAIWARVSRCRCTSRESVRARSPSAVGPSRQQEDDTDED